MVEVPTKDEITTWRETRGMSQADLARQLGVSPMTLWKWENDQRKPPAFLRLALEALATRIEEGKQVMIETMERKRTHGDDFLRYLADIVYFDVETAAGTIMNQTVWFLTRSYVALGNQTNLAYDAVQSIKVRVPPQQSNEQSRDFVMRMGDLMFNEQPVRVQTDTLNIKRARVVQLDISSAQVVSEDGVIRCSVSYTQGDSVTPL